VKRAIALVPLCNAACTLNIFNRFKGMIMYQHTLSCFARTLAARSLVVVALAVSGLAVPMAAQAQSGGHAHMNTGQAPKDMHASMMNMQQQMDSVKASGDTDYDFALMMRIHHQGAVDMAQMELDKGKDPQLQAMAKEIIAAQKKEIAQFDQWIAEYKKQKK
jgi:uncharacterized protein (DUF305 family)